MSDPVTEAVKRLNAEGLPAHSTRIPDLNSRDPFTEVLTIDNEGHVWSAEVIKDHGLVLVDGRPWSAEPDSAEPATLIGIRKRFGPEAAQRVARMIQSLAEG